MNTILIVCAVLLTIAIIVAVIFLIQTLIQVQNTARQAEMLLKNLNQELAAVERITSLVSSFVEKFSSPWVKVGSWATAIASALWMKRKKGKETQDSEEE